MKNTKKSLITSVVALLLCFSMLLGATYAWFTDVATSNSNVVQTGNLDAEMYWSDTLLAADSNAWQNAEGVPIFTYDNWEPGYTDVKYIKVKNAGNLAFQWRLSIEAQGSVTDLADVIDVYYINPVSETVTTLSGKTTVGVLSNVIDTNKYTNGVLLPATEVSTEYASGETILAIALHMQEDAGNHYKGKSIGDGFAVRLIATQFNYEGDSFNNKYDETPEWPDNVIVGGNSASATVEPTSDNKVSSAVSLLSSNGVISAEVPAGVKLDPDVTKLTLNVSDVANSQANVTLNETESSLSIDVHIDGVAGDNDVVMAIGIKELLPVGLNMGNYRFYHVENEQTVAMTLLAEGAVAQHNNYEYDPATGDVVLYLKSFSEVAMIAEPAAWEGNRDYSWYTNAVAPVDGEAVTEYIIANADQLAGLSAIVGGMAEGIEQDGFDGKTVKLVADINLGDKESENNPDIIFYPIGYNSDDGKYEKTGVAVSTGFYNFCGTFDGNGHTVSNFYQNTWEMKGDHNWYDATLQYYRDGMGLFGRVYGGTVKNLTVENFSSDGEITTTGTIAAYADGATFENISIFNCNPRVYNIGNGGIVGCVGWYAKDEGLKTTFTNITVDNSNKISALWGSYDVACGGIVGQYYPTSGQTSAGTPKNAGIEMNNCHVAAQMDVYNDVCANYQYYAYRYAGMLIGSVRENETIGGHVYPKMDGITAEGCTVHFGTWNDYYYCEIIDNTTASYTHDYQMSRLVEIKAIDGTTITYLDDSIGTVPASGRANYVIVDYTKGHGTENATCYHFKDGEVWTHDMGGIQTGVDENGDGKDDLKEDKQHIYLEFNNLVTGYGWGVTSKGVNDLDGVTILDRAEGTSVEKFEGKVNELANYKTYKFGDIFTFIDSGVELIPDALTVSITNKAENNPVSATIVYDSENWENSTIIFTGVGAITITIQDYYFCTPTTIEVSIKEHEHVYDNGCDVDCNVCGATREPNHTYDVVVTDPDCVNGGHTTYTCSVCGHSYEDNRVEALGHTYNAVVTAPTCTKKGYTTYTCTCGDTYIADEVAALGHTEVVDAAVAPTCTETGLTEGKHCSVCNEVLIAQTVVAAKGHKYNAVVTDPDCVNGGYTTYTCTCGDTYIADEVAALGHIKTNFTGDFLYRVGNQNAVQLSSLFNVGNRDDVTIDCENISGNASVTINGTSLTFNKTGVVKVTLSSDCTCNECTLELNLEVVDAENATGATNATSNNVVLLNDCGFGSLEVSGGYTLYGNGFTMTCGSDSAALDMGYAFVTLNNGTLDNVQIVCPNFDYAVLYKSNMTESGNRSETTDKTRYFNVKSGVMVSGNSQILNSRISGARAAVNVTGGNVLIDNSRIELGAVASLLVGSANSVTLRDVTLVQKPTASTYDSSKTLMGFSVLFVCDADGNATPVTLEGTLVQNAWVDENDKQYVPSAGQSIISTVLGKTEYLHDLDGDGTKESLNLGFAYMPESLTSKVNTTTITDNRTNKDTVPYDYAEVSILTGKTYVYSYKNTNGTADSFKTEKEYTPNKYGDIITVNYSDTNENRVLGKVFGEGGWVYQLSVDLDQGAYTFDFSKLTVQKNGVSMGISRLDKVNVEEGTTAYTLTLDDGSTIIFKLIGTATTKDAPQWSSDANGSSLSTSMNASWEAGLCVASSKGGTWSGAAPALQNVYIRYYSTEAKAYKVIHLADYTPNVTGKVNGSNTTCTITGPDFTLTLTGGQVHSSNKVSAIPVVCDNKLYFVAATTSGLVNSGNSARSVPVSYSFTDGFGNTLSGSHTWSVAEDQNNEYKYSDFCNGTLTKLEGSGDGCVTPDTLITLADGTQVRVDSLTGDEMLLVWNMETGKLDYAPIMFVDSDPTAEYEVVKLIFSDGTEVKVIYEHGFWDYDLNKYVYLDANAADYIGHTFAKQNGESLEKVQLVDVVIETEVTTAWSPVTVGHLCYFVNGMLSMPGGVGGLFNIFEVDPETMTYDYEQIEKDIETYGLYTYEELNAICPLSEEMFNAAGGAYLKISIGKGNLTIEELINMINRYSKYI